MLGLRHITVDKPTWPEAVINGILDMVLVPGDVSFVTAKRL